MAAYYFSKKSLLGTTLTLTWLVGLTNPSLALAKETSAAHSSATAAPVHAVSAHPTETKDAIDGKTALRYLKNGNIRFTKGYLRKDGLAKSDLKRLSTGQHPHSIILSCSDSRVPPEIVFDQKLGEIFVVRTAGEVIEPTAIASIEYAIEHLGAKNLVVMGHTQCGAVKAALSTLGGKDAGSPNLNKLVADIHPRLSSFKDTPPSENYSKETWANAKGVAVDLLKRSEIINKAVRTGELTLSSAVYNLHSGVVDFE